ncbi:MAG: hypothetical protein WDO73_18090 [Ignavibacteriota bacterium]
MKLYLTDGTYHLVREYQVQTDRVRYFSVERGEWEEIPLEMVDLKRTKEEVKEREESLAKEEKVVAEESAAEARREKGSQPHPAGSRSLLAGGKGDQSSETGRGGRP